MKVRSTARPGTVCGRRRGNSSGRPGRWRNCGGNCLLEAVSRKTTLYRFLVDDHVRLDPLLQELTGRQDIVKDTAYLQFRAGILRHIAMEEKVLLPFAREERGGDPLPIARRIRLDHGAIAALLAPTPTPQIIATMRAILEAHNPIEEGSGGLYETVEELAGTEVDALLDRVRSVPEVRLAPHSDSSRALESMRQAVELAGYRLDSTERPGPGE